MESAQRRVLHAVTGAYNTVSTRALQVLAGTPPIHLHIESSIRVQNGMTKTESEDILIQQWQTLWDSTSKGRWTYEFLPDIRVRIRCPISFDHYTAQIVTGHGDFNGKLYYFNLAETPKCNCGHGVETAEHILKACPYYDDLRSILKNSISSSGVGWPCANAAFTTSRTSWTAHLDSSPHRGAVAVSQFVLHVFTAGVFIVPVKTPIVQVTSPHIYYMFATLLSFVFI